MKIGSDNTILKIVIVLVITLGVLGAISIFSFRSYREFSDALDKLYNPPDETSITENILTGIGTLESHARTYALTLESKDLNTYIRKVEDINVLIDSLSRKSDGREYQSEVDSLKVLFNEKVQSFENLIDLKVMQSRRNIDRSALRALSRTQETLLGDSLLVPKQEITTTTTTRTQSVENEGEVDGPNLFQRVFGSSKKEKEDRETVPVRSEVRQEKTIAYDSAYFEKVDTLILSARKALEEAEVQRQQQSALLAGKELEMASKDQVIYNQLRTIILKIKEKEEEVGKVEKTETLSTARESFTSIALFALCGGILAMVLIYFVIRDIIKSRKLQNQLHIAKSKAEELASVKEEFLANMSHEIRTPLNAIIGFSEQLASSDLKKEQRSKLQKVRSSSEHLLMLVNDILDYSKIESGKLRLEEIGFQTDVVVSESLATLEHLAETKGIKLYSEVDPELKNLVLKGDPIRLKQILINLAGNGVKFTSNGYVKIGSRIVKQAGEKYWLEFVVEDTGKGIAPEKLETIFEGFDQEDTSISRKYGGTGLGLTISKKLATLLEGKIRVSSAVGEGSVFTVLLPFEKGEKDEYSGKFDLDRVEINLEGKKLLLIDDDSMNHVLLKPSLKRWGLEFESCYNGDDGIAVAQKTFFDYVLVDLQMPGKSGLEVVGELRKENSACKNSAIIICTANAMVRRSEDENLKLADATLLKPFKEYEVAALLAGIEPRLNEEKPASTQSPAYSLVNFLEFAGGDYQVLKSFLESFIETNKEHLILMHSYFDREDYYNVGDVAHKMKNTFGQLDAHNIMQHLLELEKLVDSSQPKRLVKELIEETQRLSELLFTQLEQEIEKLEKEPYTSNP